MEGFKKQWLPRILIGGTAGMALELILIWTDVTETPLPTLAGLCLSFLLGAEAGIATLPFAASGRELVVRSLVHYAGMAVTVCLWAGVNFGWWLPICAAFLILLTLVYFIVWLGRWVGWYAEVAAIREKLGLAPGPSLFHWKETLPYAGFALLLCLALPTLLRLVDAADVPVLSVTYTWLLLPVGGFMSGLSLGRRHGFCPLYPVACGAFIGVFILTEPPIDGGMLFTAAVASTLAGNAVGAVRRKMKQKREGA